MPVEFWMNDPNILFQSLQFYPSSHLSLEEMLNAFTRSILLCSIFILYNTHNRGLFIVIILSLLFIKSLVFFS